MSHYEIKESSLKCCKTGRDLRPGEQYFSVLFDRGEDLERQDYCEEAWDGPPADAFSFWRTSVPKETEQKPTKIDDETAHDCFLRLADQTESKKVRFRYVLGLLLMRRKRLKFIELRQNEDLELMVLRCPRSGQEHQVINPKLSEAEFAELEVEARQVLSL